MQIRFCWLDRMQIYSNILLDLTCVITSDLGCSSHFAFDTWKIYAREWWKVISFIRKRLSTVSCDLHISRRIIMYFHIMYVSMVIPYILTHMLEAVLIAFIDFQNAFHLAPSRFSKRYIQIIHIYKNGRIHYLKPHECFVSINYYCHTYHQKKKVLNVIIWLPSSIDLFFFS